MFQTATITITVTITWSINKLTIISLVYTTKSDANECIVTTKWQKPSEETALNLHKRMTQNVTQADYHNVVKKAKMIF